MVSPSRCPEGPAPARLGSGRQDRSTGAGGRAAAPRQQQPAPRNQALKDEIARLKNLPPRPPFKPSGMDKATQPRPAGPGRRPGRGAKRDRVTREVTLRAEVPPGSRFKGYKTVVRRDLVLAAEVVRYKRERWLTPRARPSSRRCRRGSRAGTDPACAGSASPCTRKAR